MDQDGLPIVGTGIDYTQVEPFDKKRLLAFVNHFVAHTVQFLNNFSGICEKKLQKIEAQLHRMEITMNILEAKLSSIPGMDDIKLTDKPAAAGPTPSTAAAPAAPANSQTSETPATSAGPPPPADQAAAEPEPAQPEPDVPKVSKDPRYMKFFKMVNVGVPPPAIKLKMAAEGLNPDLLDTPNAPAPPGGNTGDSSDDSDEPFTDSD